MPNIRVTCPACKTELEIDAAFEGQEVECGNCLEVFKAKKPGAGGSSGAGKTPGAGTSGSGRGKPAPKAAARKRRDDDDDDEYDHDRRRRDDDDDDDYDPRPRRSGGAGLGVASLVLGIFSLLTAIATICCCPFVAIPFSLGAIITGVFGLQKPESKAMSIIGLTLGVISLGICAVILVLSGAQMQMNPNRFR
jgi:predicted Zn finger-like uncharacterized protein